jgi:hypothetical protein
MSGVQTVAELRELAREVQDAAQSGDEARWRAGGEALAGLDGREWLLFHSVARSYAEMYATSASVVTGWSVEDAADVSGFVAVVTSLHADGRVRERAVRALAASPVDAAVPALAVRLLDHVRQVRGAAREALRVVLGPATAVPVLDVVLAGRDRQHAPDALAWVSAHLREAVGEETLLAALMGDAPRGVRRWAFEEAHDRRLLSTADLVAAARADRDQWMQTRCAGWLMDEPGDVPLAPLLTSSSVEARLTALTRAADDELTDAALERLVLDRAPRVREQARWRARRRGLDLLGLYRARLAASDTPPGLAAASLDGLARLGDGSDLPAAKGRLRDASPRVRAQAVTTVAALAGRDEAVEALAPLLLDPAARASAAAARALAPLDAPSEVVELAWTSDRATSRRAAWRLARAAGDWERVVADLRAAADPEPSLAGLGLSGVRNWVAAGAATTYAEPTPAQRDDLEALLDRVGLRDTERRFLAFCARIRLSPLGPPRSDEPPAPRSRRTWLDRVLRR